MEEGLKIKFFTRSFDLRLYRCSKGLYEGLGYPLVRLTDCSADGEEKVRRLIDAANEAGGPDNITVILAEND